MKRFFLLALLLASSPAWGEASPSQILVSPCPAAPIVTTNVAVTILPAGLAPHGYMLQNNSTTEVAWFSPSGTAVAGGTGSFSLAPGAATTFAGAGNFGTNYGIGTGTAVSWVAVTVGHALSCAYW
jgi:hypothetical protein